MVYMPDKCNILKIWKISVETTKQYDFGVSLHKFTKNVNQTLSIHCLLIKLCLCNKMLTRAENNSGKQQ